MFRTPGAPTLATPSHCTAKRVTPASLRIRRFTSCGRTLRRRHSAQSPHHSRRSRAPCPRGHVAGASTAQFLPGRRQDPPAPYGSISGITVAPDDWLIIPVIRDARPQGVRGSHRHAPWTSVHSRGRRPQTALPVDIHISNLGMLGIDNFTRHQPPEVANLAVGAAPLSTRCRPGSWSDHDQAHPGPRPGVSLIAPGRGPRALDGRWPTQSARPQGHPRRAVLIIILSAGDEPPTLAPQIACITQGTHRGCSEPPGSSGG